MNVLKIPFVDTVGITKRADDQLELEFKKDVQNHLNTIHASAQFTLAETASGKALLQQFPELEGKVIPLLRDADIKFKKPALKTIHAKAAISDELCLKFSEQLAKKGRASIAVDVTIVDSEETVTCVGTFNWFVQSI